MNITMEKSYEGWHVQVKCRELKDNNGAGLGYDASAEARLLDPQYFENGWIEVEALTIPEQGAERFGDCATAQQTLWEKARCAIDQLKKVI